MVPLDTKEIYKVFVKIHLKVTTVDTLHGNRNKIFNKKITAFSK